MLASNPRRDSIAPILAVCLFGWASSASAQALPPVLGDRGFRLSLVDAPMTIEAPFSDFAATPPGEIWKMPLSGAFYCDGLALVSVSLKRSAEPGTESTVPALDVVVEMKAWPQIDDKVTDLELVVAAGPRQLSLGRLTDIRVRPGETKSFARTFSLDAHEFDSFFAFGSAPTLRVTRTTRSP
jgi:hypothetical protein